MHQRIQELEALLKTKDENIIEIKNTSDLKMSNLNKQLYQTNSDNQDMKLKIINF